MSVSIDARDQDNVAVEVEMEDQTRKKSKSKADKKSARFEAAEDIEGAPEVAILDEKKDKPQARGMTFANVRKTIVQGAQEVGGAVSDATSYAIATSVEHIIVAIKEMGTDWGSETGGVPLLSISEAFLLMWRSPKGVIDGRRSSTNLQALMFGTVMAEMLKQGLVSFEIVPKAVGAITWKRYVVHPTGAQPPENFLFENFAEIKDTHDEGQRATIAKWVENVATGELGTQTVQNVIDELEDKGILSTSGGTCFDHKFNLVKKEPYDGLVDAMRKTLLDDQTPSVFITILLRFMRLADKEYVVKSPFLNHVLRNKEEWARAKDRLAKYDKLPHEP